MLLSARHEIHPDPLSGRVIDERRAVAPARAGHVRVRADARPQEREEDEAGHRETDGEERDLDLAGAGAHAGTAPRPARSEKTKRPRTTGTARNGSSTMRRLPSRSAHSTEGARCAAAAIATLVSAARQPSITFIPRSCARAIIARASAIPPHFCSFTLIP